VRRGPLQRSQAVRHNEDQRQSRVTRIGLRLTAPEPQASIRPEGRRGFAALQCSLLGDCSDGSGSKCRVQIQVTIGPIASKRNKQAAWRDGSRVDNGVRYRVAGPCGRQSRSEQRLSDVV